MKVKRWRYGARYEEAGENTGLWIPMHAPPRGEDKPSNRWYRISKADYLLFKRAGFYVKKKGV